MLVKKVMENMASFYQYISWEIMQEETLAQSQTSTFEITAKKNPTKQNQKTNDKKNPQPNKEREKPKRLDCYKCSEE